MRIVPSIATMTPDKIMLKKPFCVPVPLKYEGTRTTFGPGLETVDSEGEIRFEKKTQADFLREWYPSSHKINSIIYYPNRISKGKDGRLQAKVHTRIAIAYQQMIKTKRKTALIGNNVGMRLITNKGNQAHEDILARIREGWEESNMEIAIDKCLHSDFVTGDCAVYVYMADGKVGWRTFSYEDGDILYPHYHPLTGELCLLGRKYTVEAEDGNEETYLDVIDDKFFMTYKYSLSANDKGEWVAEGEPVRHNFPFCPVAYHRSVGPVWYPSQSLIESQEMSLSQFAENNLSYGLRILYTLGADFELSTQPDGTPTRIDSSDPNAKVGFLENALGADGAFAKQLEIGHKNIMRCSFAVETPEVKSGADMSSLTVKMLFADSYIKAIEDSQEYQIFLDRVMFLFKYAYGICEELTPELSKVKVKPYLDPFVFMSETEIVNALVQLTAAGVLSRRTATEIAYNSGYGTACEYERVLQQEHDDLVKQEKESTAASTGKTNVVAQSRQSATKATAATEEDEE